MERPLDTIRSFEAAIDSGYETRRRSVQPGRPESSLQQDSRASSMYSYTRQPKPVRFNSGSRRSENMRLTQANADMQSRRSSYYQGKEKCPLFILHFYTCHHARVRNSATRLRPHVRRRLCSGSACRRPRARIDWRGRALLTHTCICC